MIVQLGSFALVLALFLSLAQVVVPLIGAARNRSRWMQAGRWIALVNAALVVTAFGALMYAHVTDDFSVLNVVMNSHSQKPLLYKITGTWASHEGSMMLWVLILALFGAGLATFLSDMPLVLRARALAVQGMTGVGFLAFIILTSNPFTRVWPAAVEGNDLNPLLQDPGLAFHPPFLYIGYVGFSSVFALAAAVLLTKDLPSGWARWLRPYALMAWSSLTFGIAMGSWWAYYELGWGGWWFWDPVENAALMPWLAGTTLVHSLLSAQQRGAFLRWTILLSILTFSLSLLGTFLVRSGVLTSVHTFAVDPERGLFMLGLLALAVGGALTLYAARSWTLPGSALFAPVSRETALLLNNLFLGTACATLMTGTLYPLLLDALGGGTVSVGPPYFNAAVIPLILPALLLMVIGPILRWQKDDLAAVLGALKWVFGLTLVGLLFTLYMFGLKSILGLVAVTLGLWLLVGTLLSIRHCQSSLGVHLPRLLAHAGLGVSILGMAGSAFSQEHTFLMQPKQSVDFSGYHLTLDKVEDVQGPNYEAARGTFSVTHRENTLVMKPEQRFYPVQGSSITNVAIHTNGFGDLYLAMGEEQDNGDGVQARVVRFHINPLVPWIWIGGTIMALGGLMGALQKRRAS